MNTQTELKTAGRAALADLQTLAAQGVERALAARGLTELTPDQVEAVSGAASVNPLLKRPLINGIVNPEIFKAIQVGQLTQPQINPATFGGLVGR